jgi:hypothetical protein
MSSTVWGIAGRINGISVTTDSYGNVVGGRSFEELDTELGSSMIDLDHNGQHHGDVVYGEITRGGQILLAGVVDLDLAQLGDRPVYLSGLYEMSECRGNNDAYIAKRAQALSYALNLNPASVEVSPLRSHPGVSQPRARPRGKLEHSGHRDRIVSVR